MQAGTVLDGRYRLVELIGAGGFGQVWKAHDPKVDRLVAVKVLTGGGSADGSRHVARFAREAAVAGGLAHPNIVTVHDFGSAMCDGRLLAYLVMELLPGEPLSAAVAAGRLPLPDALYIAGCVADALDAAHDAGLTHRDIKPSNIMVRPSGRANVVDFGITKGSDDRHDITTTGVLIGTPAYMAPSASAAPSTTAPTCTRSDACSTKWSLGSGPSAEPPGTWSTSTSMNSRHPSQPAPRRPAGTGEARHRAPGQGPGRTPGERRRSLGDP